MTVLFADPDKRNADEAGSYLPGSVREPCPDDPNLPLPIGELLGAAALRTRRRVAT